MSYSESARFVVALDSLRKELRVLYELADRLAGDLSSREYARFVQVEERVNSRLEQLAKAMAANSYTQEAHAASTFIKHL